MRVRNEKMNDKIEQKNSTEIKGSKNTMNFSISYLKYAHKAKCENAFNDTQINKNRKL